MRSESSGRVVPKTCKSWLCSECNVWLRQGAARLIRHGAAEAYAGGRGAALFTFTEPATATLDLPTFYGRMQRTIQRLRHRGWVTEYVTAVEFQKRGALHPHVVASVPTDLLELLPDHGQQRRDRAQWSMHFRELVPMARDLGWGPMCDVRRVGVANDLGAYATKRLAGYSTKEAYRLFKDAGAHRVRPIRSSRQWAPKSLREFQRGDKAVDEGPWVDATSIGSCS